ncbi:beta-Ala-His dipeptidase [bacterium]|nr:beta-Ala-His dipeptidase [bacterium]
MNQVRNLEPKIIWNHFEDLNEVPRASKKEEGVVQWIIDFGKSLGLETLCDHCVAQGLGNVVIKKPASPGMEDRPTVILQSHLDMVHQKNSDTDFDFGTQGIQSFIDGDWVKANGTTLGADNGMGVAASMAVLSSTDIKHPAIEALFTIDEETGMTGAINIDNDKLQLTGSILLNLDTEDDDELCIGCAGGIDTNVSWEYEETEAAGTGMKLVVKGLVGGHSGMDIILGRGNANKIMNRLLYKTREMYGVRIASIDGGGLRNAIPRESVAILKVHNVPGFRKHIIGLTEQIEAEYHNTDPALRITIEEIQVPAKAMSAAAQDALLAAIYALPNGVYRMHPQIPDLVETSSSLARIIVGDGKFTSQSLQRSSSESAKMDLANAIRSAFELIGANVQQGGEYPGWEPLPDAPILKTMRKLYENMFNEAPNVRACHAGLECGIIGKHFPGLHMISFGPTIKGPHSPDEKVNIKSVDKFWKFLLNTLEHIPNM